MENDLDKLIGQILFCEDADLFMRVTKLDRYTEEQMGGAVFVVGETIGAQKREHVIEPEDIGETVFVIADDFPMEDIERYMEAELTRCAANAEMFQIEMQIPDVKRKRELDDKIPF